MAKGDQQQPESSRETPGGVVHTYMGYDPTRFPPPTQPPPDMVSGAFDHMLTYGSARELTEEELARAIKLDPSQIQGLGPSLESLIARLEERKRKILETYEATTAQKRARRQFHEHARQINPPGDIRQKYEREVRDEQIRGLESLWYIADRLGREGDRFAARLPGLVEDLETVYAIDSLAAKYDFTGRDKMSIEEALAIKEELETIDRLLEQLREAMKNAQIALIDMDALADFVDQEDVQNLGAMQRQVQELLRELAEQQGIESTRDGVRLTPKAMRLFQSKLLATIFAELDAGRSGRHQGPISGEGAVELPRTRAYEFGDSATHMDVVQTIQNAMLRRASRGESVVAKNGPHFIGEDIRIHETRNNPKCATAVLMDMSGSMRSGGLYIGCKRMALALDGLIRSEYPGDWLRFFEMYTFAKERRAGEIATLMPKIPTIRHPVVQLKADMSDPEISELDVPPHFTNIQHAMRLARTQLAAQDTPNRQIILITDGLPTAHFEGDQLYLLYPPHPRTEERTMREAAACKRDGITINIFLLPTWSQSEEDVQFAHRMAEQTGGRVFFAAGENLDRFVLWDYVQNRRRIIGG